MDFSGDASAVKRFWLGGQDMAGEDYDQRTALHLGKKSIFYRQLVSGELPVGTRILIDT